MPSEPDLSHMVALACVSLVPVFGCTEESARDEQSSFQSASQTLTKPELAREIGLEWERDLSLEESEQTVNVEIAVRTTDEGDFLVSDAAEAQIRRYAADGSLKWAFGQEGDGPLGFDAPSVALQVGEDSVLVVDAQAKIAIVSPAGDSLLSTFTVPVGPIYDADLLDERHVLLSGRSVDGPDRLHVVDVRAGEIVRSFFPPPVGDERSVNAVGLTNSSVWGDTIATAFALADTIYYHDAEGRELARRAFRSEHFRPWNAPPPVSARTAASAREWYRSFSYTTEVFRPADSLTIVQYQDRARDMSPRWRLVGVHADGSTAFDLEDSPRLLAVRPDRDQLVFVNPGSLTPDRWSIATLR